MIFVKHRLNTINKLKKLNKSYGAEIDLRASGKKIILEHESFKKGTDFKKWLNHYDHSFLIANIKEEGIEKNVIKSLKEKGINDYFLLDVTVPMLIKLNNNNIFDVCLRVSKYENISNLRNFNRKNKWLWFDTFEKKIPTNNNELNKLKKLGFKICLVSPELITNKKNDIKEFFKKNFTSIRKMNMICTKFPKHWESLFDKKV